jgi:hypothetical protein
VTKKTVLRENEPRRLRENEPQRDRRWGRRMVPEKFLIGLARSYEQFLILPLKREALVRRKSRIRWRKFHQYQQVRIALSLSKAAREKSTSIELD